MIAFRDALARLEEIMEFYADCGAADTEPRSVAVLAVSNALDGLPVIIPMMNSGWELYDGSPAKIGWLLGEALDDMVKAAMAGDPDARRYVGLEVLS